jgi:hypothetical protein
MSAPTPSDLDASQCIQGAYDDANGRLRVDASITAPLDINGEVLVDIRATDGDSVLVVGTEDGTPTGTQHVLKVAPDGTLITNTTLIGTTNVNIHDSTGGNLTSTSGSLNANITNIIPVSQSGAWTTGRTWSLLNTTDSVNIGNFPATQAVTQSTSPWIISGIVTANIGTTNGLALDSSLTTINTSINTLLKPSSTLNSVTTVGTIINPVAVTQSTSPWVISGTITANAGTNLNTSALALSATQTNGNQKTQIVDGSGNVISSNANALNVALPLTNTSTITRIASSISDTTLLSSNSIRKAAIFFNESTAIAYLKLGSASSLTSYTLQMDPRSTFIIEGNPIYYGQVNCTWSVANGFMEITELI